MGTRNLTMVVSGGQTKVAQYGQWDGYPGGQGDTALAFLLNCDLDKFKEKVDVCRFLTNDEIETLNKASNPFEKHPWLSRDLGAQILSVVNGESYIERELGESIEKTVDFNGELVNSEQFAGDSLFCEWAYVIDLDKRTFEVYEGFNDSKELTEKDRFFHLTQSEDVKKSKYNPVTLVKEYSLDELPTRAEFIDYFNKLHEQEE